MSKRLVPLSRAASLVAALHGCDSGEEPSQQDYDGVATAMSSALVSEDEGNIAAMGEVVLIVEGSVPSDMEDEEEADAVYVGGPRRSNRATPCSATTLRARPNRRATRPRTTRGSTWTGRER